MLQGKGIENIYVENQVYRIEIREKFGLTLTTVYT